SFRHPMLPLRPLRFTWVMRSVPPRGSGWVVLSDCYTEERLGCKIDCMRSKSTRYRVVVLTSFQLTKARMAIRAIVEYPDPVLLSPGQPVENFDSELESLVRDMFDTMYDAGGVGLAAQQIGLSLRLFVMDCDGIKLVAANPEIVSVAGE